MRIAISTGSFEKKGGISRYAVELAERFVEDNELHIITSEVGYDLPAAKFHKVKTIPAPISAQVATFALEATRAARDLKRRGIVELIHGQGAEILSPDVLTAHSCQKAATQKIGAESGLAYRMLKSFEPRNRIVLAIDKHNFGGRRYQKVIAVSQNVKDDLMRCYSLPDEDITVVYNGVNIEEFNPENKAKYSADVRARHGLKSDDAVLLFCGWEFKRKGLHAVIESLPQLNKDVKLLVVGQADRRLYIDLARKLGVSERVIFVGQSDNMAEYYAASDIFVLPTAYEPFGMVITEAMAAGIPVVTSKIAGAAELITDGVDGMLLERPHDSVEVSEKIRYILDNDLVAKMGASARKCAQAYSWDRTARETLKVYQDVIG